MPLYEYVCPGCKTKFEARKPMSKRQSAACPNCGRRAGKVMSACGFTFGWTLSERSHERFGPRDEIVRDI